MHMTKPRLIEITIQCLHPTAIIVLAILKTPKAMAFLHHATSDTDRDIWQQYSNTIQSLKYQGISRPVVSVR